MVQSPSWEANWFAASQETPRISRNPKVHYRTHKRPPPFSILGQPNPVHIPTSHLLEIRPNIIHPSTPRSPQWSPSLRFPHQDPIHPPLLTHTRHMPSNGTALPLHFFWLLYCIWNDSYFLSVFQLLSSLKLGTYIPVLSFPSIFILLCFLSLFSPQLYSSLTCFPSVFTTSIIFLNICTGIMDL